MMRGLLLANRAEAGMIQRLNHRIVHYGILLAAGSLLFLLNLGGLRLSSLAYLMKPFTWSDATFR